MTTIDTPSAFVFTICSLVTIAGVIIWIINSEIEYTDEMNVRRKNIGKFMLIIGFIGMIVFLFQMKI